MSRYTPRPRALVELPSTPERPCALTLTEKLTGGAVPGLEVLMYVNGQLCGTTHAQHIGNEACITCTASGADLIVNRCAVPLSRSEVATVLEAFGPLGLEVYA